MSELKVKAALTKIGATHLRQLAAESTDSLQTQRWACMFSSEKIVVEVPSSWVTERALHVLLKTLRDKLRAPTKERPSPINYKYQEFGIQ
jgi:hypothetical protein